MSRDDWKEAFPLGMRVRVPYKGWTTIEGEVVGHYRLTGRPAVQVRVQMPVSHEPFETVGVTLSFRPERLEIIADQNPTVAAPQAI
jgi:hypothetical protein